MSPVSLSLQSSLFSPFLNLSCCCGRGGSAPGFALKEGCKELARLVLLNRIASHPIREPPAEQPSSASSYLSSNNRPGNRAERAIDPVAMPQSGSVESPKDDYFNDLSQQPSADANSSADGARRNSDEAALGTNESQPKAKRIACVLCRKRKLRCDGARPTCGTCKRLSHECAYDEVRKKSGPKRGYVKLLEARLRMSPYYNLVAIRLSALSSKSSYLAQRS